MQLADEPMRRSAKRGDRRRSREDRAHERRTHELIRDLKVKRRESDLALGRARKRILGGDSPGRIYPVLATWDPEHLARVATEREQVQAGQVASVGATCAGSGDVALRWTDPATASGRYRLLDALRGISANKRTRVCGRKRIAEQVQLEARDGKVRLLGVARCCALHDCPVCASSIYARRAREVDAALEQWIGYGDERKGPATAWAGLVTFTVKHSANQATPGAIARGLSAAWRRMHQGRAWQVLERDLGLEHWIRALEATHGANGWHDHYHALFCCSAAPSPEALRRLAERWRDSVEAELGPSYVPQIDLRDTPTGYRHFVSGEGSYQSIGVDCVRLTAESRRDYITKMGQEVASTDTKHGKGSRGYWAVARDAAEGHAPSIALWKSATESMRGVKMLTWSKGAKKFFGIPDLDDSEVVALEEEGILPTEKEPPRLIASVEGARWDESCRRNRWALSDLMQAAKTALETNDWGPVVAHLARPGPMSICRASEVDSCEAFP